MRRDALKLPLSHLNTKAIGMRRFARFLPLAALVAGTIALGGASWAQSAEETARIERKMDVRMAQASTYAYGCTAIRQVYRKLRREHPSYHFVFAGRRAPTITGMRGCGYAWGADLEKARAEAMAGCKRQEEKLGTNGGKRTCRFLN